MLAHYRASAIPRLEGRCNYKEWSRKVELHMRVVETWAAVLSPPRPIETQLDDNIEFVAARKCIYIACPVELDRRVKRFLQSTINPEIMPSDYLDWSVPQIWLELKRKFGKPKSPPKRKLKLNQHENPKKAKVAKVEEENLIGD